MLNEAKVQEQIRLYQERKETKAKEALQFQEFNAEMKAKNEAYWKGKIKPRKPTKTQIDHKCATCKVTIPKGSSVWVITFLGSDYRIHSDYFCHECKPVEVLA